MKLKLYTNFRDYYDYMFDLEGKIFERLDVNDLIRNGMFGILSNTDLITPLNGKLKDTSEEILSNSGQKSKVVVYLDESKHRGDGKILLPIRQALNYYSEYYCSEFVKPDIKSSSWRYLQVGKRCYILNYQSDDYWRSNVGNVVINFIEENVGRMNISNPLFAVDFVVSSNIPYAVDFNTAPRIGGTPVEEMLSAGTVVDLIKETIYEN